MVVPTAVSRVRKLSTESVRTFLVDVAHD
jgi:hypothetical protein